MMIRTLLYFLISIGFYFISKNWIHSFKHEDYKDYVSLVSTVSGMVFTIMGIWIAFLYPNAMNRIINPKKLIIADFTESRSDAKRLESIVGAVMASAFALVGTLAISFAKLLLFHTSFYIDNRIEIKALALSGVIFITLVQLESVLHVILSNVMFINDLHFKRQARQADEEL